MEMTWTRSTCCPCQSLIGIFILEIDFCEMRVMVALLVIALYMKTARKKGKHMAITHSSRIFAVSYIDVPVFKHMYSGLF